MAKNQYLPSKDPNLGLSEKTKERLLRMAKKSIELQAQESAKENQNEIAPEGKLPPQQMWLPCAPMPTELCRVSPFFPMPRRGLSEREYVRDMVIAKSSWGEIVFRGPKLTTYEEDCLSAVLAILDMIDNRRDTTVDGRSTYTYKGPFLPILKLVNPNTTKFGKTNYKRVYDALELMVGCVITLRINKRSTGGKTVSREAMNLISCVKWNDGRTEIEITINPYFYENFARGNVTLLDVIRRAELRSPIAKSLYRFVMSHREDRWEGHFLTLAQALNLDLEQAHKELKRYIKRAIKNLSDNKLLDPKSGFNTSDVVVLLRTSLAKQRRSIEK